MESSIGSLLQDVARAFRVADAVDIAFISLIIYAALVWFRETTSRRVLIGISALICVYFASREFNRYLTSQLFHVGFTLLMVVLVVIFQEDLRRVFERIATGSAALVSKTPRVTFDTDVLVETAFDLAAKRHGALVVMHGRDPLTHHIHGGIQLFGKLSKPLLDSIFDPSSAGHDGAVLVEKGRVSRFAVHLPISKNRKEVGLLGTRHAAALGISEQADALTIVVSEERGVVSLAENGTLVVTHSAAELKRRLDAFVQQKFPSDTSAFWSRYVVKHWLAKLLSVALASLAWLLFAYNPSTVQRTFVVPVEYHNLSANLELDETVHETRVTLSGTEPAFRLLEPATLKIAIDLTGSVPGIKAINVVPRKNLTVPANLSVFRIEHSTIAVYLEQRAIPAPAVGPKQPVKGGGKTLRLQ